MLYRTFQCLLKMFHMHIDGTCNKGCFHSQRQTERVLDYPPIPVVWFSSLPNSDVGET